MAMILDELDTAVRNLSEDLATHCGFGTPAFRTRFENYARAEIAKFAGRIVEAHADMREQHERMRGALQVIAGSADELQRLQAVAALANIGPRTS
jgi:hypothetical protein